MPLLLFFLRSLSSTPLLRAPYPSKIRLTRCIMESYMYVQAGYIALKIIITVRDVHLIITGSPQGVLDYRSRESFALCPFVPLCLAFTPHPPILRFSVPRLYHFILQNFLHSYFLSCNLQYQGLYKQSLLSSALLQSHSYYP